MVPRILPYEMIFFTRVIVLMLTAVTCGGTTIYYNGTVNGNSNGAPCVFPFYYNGTSFNECINISSASWCSTTDNYTRDGLRGECIDKDVCQSAKVLSDPWRNVWFNLTSFPNHPVNDTALQEGWYHFTGIGGDRIVNLCLKFFLGDTCSFNLTDLSGTSANSTDAFVYTCDVVVDSVPHLDCGGGQVIYYLHPTIAIYITHHSSCTNTSCGPLAHCDSEGSCMCDSGLTMYNGVLPSNDSYGCTDFIPTLPEECKTNCTSECAKDLLENISNSTIKVIYKDVVSTYLQQQMNCVKALENKSHDVDQLASYGNLVLKATEKLVEAMVTETDTYNFINMSNDNLVVRVFMVGPNAPWKNIQLIASNNSLDVDLTEISKITGSAAVALLSYSNMTNLLSPNLFNSNDNTNKTMMSDVVTVTFPKTKILDPPEMDLTLQHKDELDPAGTLTCVSWDEKAWVKAKCKTIKINSTHTRCSCVYPATFALIMQTGGSSNVPSVLLYQLNLVAMPVGLVFLGLTLLTFALCWRNERVSNTALINLCISLLLAHLLFLLTQHFMSQIQEMACKVLAGVAHFLFLSAFVWMFTDSVLLCITVQNLSKIKSMQRTVLSWKWLIVIGYTIPMLMVGVSVGIIPDGYDSERCWIKTDSRYIWSFLGPVCFILFSNMIFFVIIILVLINTVRGMNNEILQRKTTTADKNLIKSVILKTTMQFFILGCPWVLGFFQGSDMMQILFICFNSQQGTFIFIVHCALNQEVRREYRKWFCRFWPSKDPASSNNDQRGQEGSSQSTQTTTK